MRTASPAFAWLAAAVLTPAAAQVAHVQVTEPLRLVGPLRPVKGGAAVYIVKLRQPGAASYKSVPMALTGEKPSEQAQAARAAAAADLRASSSSSRTIGCSAASAPRMRRSTATVTPSTVSRRG